MSEPKVLLVGNGSNLNRGCEAILRSTEQLIVSHYGRVCLENHFLCQPEDLQSPYLADPASPSASRSAPLLITRKGRTPRDRGLRLAARLAGSGRLLASSARYIESEMAARIASPGLALQLGGDNYTFDYGYPALHEAIDRALQAHGCPIVLWGASIGPFEAWPRRKRWIAAHLRKHVGLILAREPRTMAYLRTLDMEDRSYLMGDPAFTLEPEPPSADALRGLVPEGGVGVNLSPLVARYRGRASQPWVETAGLILRALQREFGRPLVLVPHVLQPASDDYAFLADALAVAQLPPDAALLLPPTLTSAQLKWVIGRLALLIGARTHATIAAFSSRVPTLSLAYSAKATGLNEMLFGDQRYVLPMAAATPEGVVQMARRVWQDRSRVRDHLDAVIPRVEARVRRAVGMLEPLMADPPRRPIHATCDAAMDAAT